MRAMAKDAKALKEERRKKHTTMTKEGIQASTIYIDEEKGK